MEAEQKNLDEVTVDGLFHYRELLFPERLIKLVLAAGIILYTYIFLSNPRYCGSYQ